MNAININPSESQTHTIMDLDQLVQRAFDWHWSHDGGASHISLDAFKAANPKLPSNSDTFISEDTLYYRSSDDTCWAIELTYLED